MTPYCFDRATISSASFDDYRHRLPCDMRDEIAQAFAEGRETEVHYLKEWEYNQQATHYLYFPGAGRGAVCEGGDSQWTDCGGIDDLMDRWANYDERWSN